MKLLNQIHPSWHPFFYREDVQEIIINIFREIGESHTPAPENIFRFAETNLSAVTCIVWGRDPYPQRKLNTEGEPFLVATGRAFEVNNVHSWSDKAINASLRNILKLLHKSYFNLSSALSIEEVRRDIDLGRFPILPPNEAFSHWQSEGVLFLNRSLTCEIGTHKGASGAHEKHWTPFFMELLAFIASEKPEAYQFLWGTAKEYKDHLLSHGSLEEKMYLSKHPSAFVGDEGKWEKDSNFLHSPCFLDSSNTIRWV